MPNTPDESGGNEAGCAAHLPILEELHPLSAEIEKLPGEMQAGLLRALQNYNVDRTRRRHTLDQIREVLEQLRLDMKYLIFDLEATRRERDDALRSGRGMGEEND
ncbi:MAG: hypothetical protein PHH13_01225 [Candidatus Peribacteraceae bacterium]|nr:hypothetical protein [Candidatus Peribacteraceae bacterium]